MIGWLLATVGILLFGAGGLILIDVLDERRRVRVHRDLERNGRKRVGL